MAEPVDAWWARRRFSTGSEVPYPVGRYREAWTSYPALVRQYHPEFNSGIVLSQIPPAADVWLVWQCEMGHLFAATPTEQRMRPGRERRRSSWCPECAAGARPPRIPNAASAPPPRRPRPQRVLCPHTPDLPAGESFSSACAPPTSSAAEAQLRHELAARIEFTPDHNAVRTSQPFFDHHEVWPDIVLPELRVAVEYDTPGRHGLEHVGPREATDRRKDRLLRATGWEVIRIRTGRLPLLGPHDLQVSGPGRRTVTMLVDALRELRGSLIVDCYRR